MASSDQEPTHEALWRDESLRQVVRSGTTNYLVDVQQKKTISHSTLQWSVRSRATNHPVPTSTRVAWLHLPWGMMLNYLPSWSVSKTRSVTEFWVFLQKRFCTKEWYWDRDFDVKHSSIELEFPLEVIITYSQNAIETEREKIFRHL